MAVLAVSLAGAAIGGATGIGVATGYVIGTIAGQLLFPPPDIEQSGPKPDDQRLTTSAYGQMLPLVYGTVSVAGNIIDASDYYTIARTETQGGKGGQKVKTTTYTRSIDLAIAVAGVEIKDVVGIFANEEMFYDTREGSSVTSPPWLQIKIYKGTEDQLPDPTLEAIHGVGNVPAYKGVAYVVFRRFQLEGYNNTIPQFRFLVVTEGVSVADEYQLETNLNGVTNGMTYDVRTGLLYTAMNINDNYSDSGLVAVEPFSRRILWQSLGRDASGTGIEDCHWPRLAGRVRVTSLGLSVEEPWIIVAGRRIESGTDKRIAMYRADTGQLINIANLEGTLNTSGWNEDALISLYKQKCVTMMQTTPLSTTYVYRHKFTDTGQPDGYAIFNAPSGYVWQQNRAFGVIQGDGFAGVTCRVCVACENSSNALNAVAQWDDVEDEVAAVYLITEFPAEVMVVRSIWWDPAGDVWWLHCQVTSDTIHFRTVDKAGNETRYDWFDLYGITARPWSGFKFDIDVFGREIWVRDDNANFYRWNIGSLVAPEQVLPTTIRNEWTWLGLTGSLWGTNSNDVYEYFPDRVREQPTTYRKVVEDISSRVDLLPTDYDASLLTAPLDGYVIGRQTTARSALEPLRKAGFFDCVDTGGTIQFRPFGQGLTRTIGKDDLGAHVASDSTPELIESTRVDEIVLPAQLNLTYIDKDSNYENGSQSVKRQASRSVQKAKIDLPIVFGSDDARQRADMMLHLMHIERVPYELSLMPHHMDLIPGDVIEVDDGKKVRRMKIVEKKYERQVVKLRTVREDPSVLDSDIIGGKPFERDTAVGRTGLMQFWLLDWPALRDEDNFAGMYGAGYSNTPGWPGGEIFRSTDNATWGSIGSIVNEAALGWIREAAGPGVQWRWDRQTTLTVQLLTETTLENRSESDVLRGANAAGWGEPGRWEIFQYATATLNADGTYTLSDLLRGRFGTEWAAELHEGFDRFVFIDTATLRRFNMQSSEIGKTGQYRGVTNGQNLYDPWIIEQPYQHDGRSLECWAAASVKGRRNFAKDLTITWNRRDRVIARAFWDPPMSEDIESYEVDIMQGQSVLRTISTSTSSALYSASDQGDDGLTPGEPVTVRIYQISVTVGRGFMREATV